MRACPNILPFAAAAVFFSGTVSALACAGGEIALFSCMTQDESHAIQLCATPDEANAAYPALRYVYGSDSGEEMSFPADPREAAKRLRFAHYFRDNLYRWSLRFETGGLRYRLYGDGDDAGVEIAHEGGLVESIACGERPVAYPDDVRKATGCDPSTSAGVKGCNPDAPELN